MPLASTHCTERLSVFEEALLNTVRTVNIPELVKTFSVMLR
jgi:hypothetical protein